MHGLAKLCTHQNFRHCIAGNNLARNKLSRKMPIFSQTFLVLALSLIDKLHHMIACMHHSDMRANLVMKFKLFM